MRLSPAIVAVICCISVATAVGTAAPDAAAKSMDAVKKGEVIDFDFDSSGRSYTTYGYKNRAFVVIRSKTGKLLTQLSARRSVFASVPRASVIGDGIVMVWFGASREVVTYTSRGRKIAGYKFNDDVVGMTGDPAVDGVEGRGGALAFTGGPEVDGETTLVRFAPDGSLIGTVSPFPPKMFASNVRFGFGIGGVLTAFASGEDPASSDINSTLMVARRLDGANALGNLLTLNVPGSGRTVFGDATAIALGRTENDSTVIAWPNVYQPDSKDYGCSYPARRVDAKGVAGPLIQTVTELQSETGGSKWLYKCPYGAAIASSSAGSTALIGYGDSLRVVRLMSSDAVHEVDRIHVGNWQRGRVQSTDSAPGWAVASWARYSSRAKRTTMSFVVANAKGTIKRHSLRTANSPASLIDVDVSPNGLLRVLVRRGKTYADGARIVTFR